jgi:undecaprenyl-diphosphatase
MWSCVACSGAFGLLLALVSIGATDRLDLAVARFVAGHRTGWLTPAMRAVTWLGSSSVLVPLVLVAGIGFLIRRRDSGPILALGLSLGGTVAIYVTLKAVVARARPAGDLSLGGIFHGLAFPSGHAAASMAVWGMLAVIGWSRGMPARRAWAIGSAVIVLLVGASRVYLGAHWLSDVLGGYALGGAVASAVAMAGIPFTRP